jgi:hypothetical protein
MSWMEAKTMAMMEAAGKFKIAVEIGEAPARSAAASANSSP